MARYLLFVIAVLTPAATFAQFHPFGRPICITKLRRAELVAPGTGWAFVEEPVEGSRADSNCLGPHLYWTDTNGRSWQEITPAHMPVTNDAVVFFLDRTHGWVLSEERLEAQVQARSYLLSTNDAGKSWRSSLVKWPSLPDDEFTLPVQVFFSDPQHGWIAWQWHTMHSYRYALQTTEDGGSTWKQLPAPPSAGPLQFISPQEGWMIGPPRTQFGTATPEDEKLLFTQDGGAHWRTVAVSLPADPEDREARFTALRFSDSRHGLVVAERQISGYVLRVFTCATDDGGKSWRISSFDAYHASPSFVGGHIVWSVLDAYNQPLKIQSGERVTSPALAGGVPLHGSLQDVGFLDDSNGWSTYDHDERSDLIATTDGGETFTIISPAVVAEAPLPAPYILAVNGRSMFMRAGPTSPILPYVPAGGVLLFIGSGFLPENTVRIGGRTIQAVAESGRGLRFFVPFDVPLGIQQVLVQNARGTSNTVQVEIRPPAPLRLSHLCDSRGKYLHIRKIHPGERISVVGAGFSQENTIWFGTRSQPANISLETSGPVLLYGFRPLYFVVPADLPPGAYDFYVSNPGGKSNVIQVQVE